MQEVQLPAGEVLQRADQRPCDRPARHLELERDHAALPSRPEEIDVDSDRHESVVALEPLGGGEHRLLRGRQERVDPDAEAIAARAARGVPKPLGGEERCGCERVRRRQCEIREARQAGLDAVHDVEAAALEREQEVRPDADRDADMRAP